MSTRHYRFYNSALGVGVTLLTRQDGEVAYVAGRDYKGDKTRASAAELERCKPYVRAAQLHLSVEQAKGKPYAAFAASPEALPEPMPDFNAMELPALAAWYERVVGYDPRADEPDLSLEVFRSDCIELYVLQNPEQFGIEANEA